MNFFKKYRKAIAVTTLAAVTGTTLLVGGLTDKQPENVVADTDKSVTMNGTMMQYFEWYLPNDGNHWNKVADQADELAANGFTALWLPPAYKGTSGSDVGYGAYDLYDLGEFNQKGSVRTKYGTKDQYLNAIQKLHDNNINVYADIVLNHKGGADTTETVNAIQCQGGNRNNTQSGNYDISAWVVFNFEGRANKYSSFKWNASCFDGVDYDNNQRKNSVFRFSSKNWDWQVDTENGNYDYLMYADVDFDNTYVVDELKNWGEWYVDFANLDGFRLDAVKHIKYDFYKDWLTTLRERTGKELFAVGEFWSPDVNKLNNYIDATQGTTSLFDVPLHYNFYYASNNGGNYDMRNLAQNTLVSSNPSKAVTFVDNHDSQPGQSLQSYVADWFKPLAYTYILTRQEGYPCVFYGDYYGISGKTGFYDVINKLMAARTKCAYGEQHNYIDNHNVIGWTREGDADHKNSGLAALITDGAGGSKKMYVGTQHAGETWYDITGNVSGTVTIDAAGEATFSVNGGSHSVWVPTGTTTDVPAGEQQTTAGIPEGDNTLTLYYKNNWNNTYAHYQVEGGSWTAVPGVKMTDLTDDYAQLVIEMGGSTKVTACFNNGGNSWDNNNNSNYSISNGTYTIVDGKIKEGAPVIEEETTTEKVTEAPTTEKVTEAPTTEAPTEEETTAAPSVSNSLTVYYKNNWSNTYAHYQVGSGEWTSAPGKKMSDVTADYAEITIDMGSATTVTACFNNGSNTWDNNSNKNYSLSAGTYTIADGKITNGAPDLTEKANTLTVYYQTGWTNAHIHYQVGSGSWTAVPGKKMDSASNGYKTYTIDMGDASKVTACFNDGGNNWDSKNGSNYSFSAGTYTVKNGKITSGTP